MVIYQIITINGDKIHFIHFGKIGMDLDFFKRAKTRVHGIVCTASLANPINSFEK